MSKITVVGCGGMGTNIALRFMDKKEKGFAEFDVKLVDTSKSNTKDLHIPEDRFYQYREMDGSGKVRGANHPEIQARAKEVVQWLKPGPINLFITSASGGSGNVIAWTLLEEVLKRDGLAVVACVGSSDSRIETQNTINALKSFESTSLRTGKPILMLYAENSTERSRGEVNHFIESNIVLFSLFFSGMNKELDMSDLKNFIHYDRVTRFSPKLTMMDFFSQDIHVEKDQALVSAVTLTDEHTSSTLAYPIEYQAVGFIPEDVKNNIKVALPIHMVSVANFFNPVIERLQKKLENFDEVKEAVVEKPILSKEEANSNGGIFL